MPRKESRLAAFCGVASIVLALLCTYADPIIGALPDSMSGGGDGLGWLGPLLAAAAVSFVLLLLHIVLTIALKGRWELMFMILLTWVSLAIWTIGFRIR